MSAEAEPLILDSTAAMNAIAVQLLARAESIAQQSNGRRFLLGIAALPGAGKSTLAGRLCEAIQNAAGPCAVVLPMDGFHLPNAELDRLGLRSRKGAPATFDVQGYLSTLGRSRDARESFCFPIYDRTLHEPRLIEHDAQRIHERIRIVITEGNYLLLDQPPWNDLATILDECWWLDIPADTARQRLLARHIAGGKTPDAAIAHVERSDDLNARLVIESRRLPDRVVVMERQ